MKKLFTVLTVLASLTLVACGGPKPDGSNGEQSGTPASGEPAHTHTFDESKWESDDTYHWHPATCGHDDQKGSREAHKWVADDSKTNVAATCQQTGVTYEKCSVCGKTRERSIAKTDHNWSEWATTTEASCGEAGKQERHCLNDGCTEKQERELDKLPHSWEVKNTVAASGDGVEYEEIECSICHAKGLRVATKKATIDGSDKGGAPEGCIKLNSNGNSMTVKINVSGAKVGQIYLTGAMDYWHDGNNDNQNKSYSSCKNDNPANFSLTVNGTEVDMSAMLTVTFGEMLPEAAGETVGSVTYSQIGDCLVGDVELEDGLNTITFKRVDSYNLAVKYFTVVFDEVA